MKHIRFLSYMSLVSLVALCLIAIIVMTTQFGTRFLVQGILNANNFTIDRESITGTLIDSIHISNLQFKDKNNLSINIGSIRFSWSPKELVYGLIQVNNIKIDSLNIKTSTSKEVSRKSNPLNFNVLRFVPKLMVEIIELNDVVVMQNDKTFEFELLKAKTQCVDQVLRLDLVELVSDAHRLTGNIQLENKAVPNINVVINWQGEVNHIASMGNIDINGPMDNLQLGVSVDSLIKINANGFIDLHALNIRLGLNGTLLDNGFNQHTDMVHTTTPVNFNMSGNMEFIDIIIKGSAMVNQTNIYDYSMESHLHFPKDKSNPFHLHTNLNATTENDKNHLLLESDIHYLNNDFDITLVTVEPFETSITATMNLVDKSHSIQSVWNRFAIKLGDEYMLVNKGGNLNIKGKNFKSMVEVHTVYSVSSPFRPSDFDQSIDKIKFNQLTVEGNLEYLTSDINANLDAVIEIPLLTPMENYLKTIKPVEISIVKNDVETVFSSNLSFVSSNDKTYDISIDSKYIKHKNNLNEFFINWFVKDGPSRGYEGYGRGIHNADNIELTYLKFDVLGGNASIDGTASLSDGEGEFSIVGNEFNFATVMLGLNSKVNFQSQYRFNTNNKTHRFDLSTISGDWRSAPLSGYGNAELNDSSLSIDNLVLEIGDNSLTSKLQLHDTVSSKIEIDFKNLSILSPDITGTAVGTFDIRGDITMPTIIGDLSASDISYLDTSIKELKLNSDIDLNKERNSSITAQMSSVNIDSYSIDSIDIEGNGTAHNHSIYFIGKSDDFFVQSLLTGNYSGSEWYSVINKFDLSGGFLSKWALTEPAQIKSQLDSGNYDVSNFCLVNNPSTICVNLRVTQSSDWKSNIILQQFPMSLIDPWMMETVSVTGGISGNIGIDHTKRQWNINSDISSEDIKLVLGTDGDSITVLIDSLSQNINTFDNEIMIDTDISSQNHFELDSNFVWSTTVNRITEGRSKLYAMNIEWLDKVEPKLTGTKGDFIVKFDMKSETERPYFNIDYKLDNGFIVYAPLGLEFNKVEGSLTMDNFDSPINVTNRFASRGHELGLLGSIHFTSMDMFDYTMNIKGEGFPLINRSDMIVIASPDISINGNNSEHHLRGQLKIPSMNVLLSIVPEDAIDISPDTSIINKSNSFEQNNTSISEYSQIYREKFDIDMSLLLGPDIHLSAFGLNTDIKGQLQLIKPKGVNLPLAKGQLNILNGTYRAYAQNLEIDSGQLIFVGPIDNPSFNIRAFRPQLPVVAGVNVNGNVKQPRISLYSDPLLTQADILSYIVTGRALDSASGSDANLISQAALSLGVEKSSLLTTQIESAFNLDDFSIQGSESLSGTSLNAGKNITPKLSVRSSFNPFEQLWSFFMNYKLTGNWSVQTESGATQGADIIYSIDTDKISDIYKKIISDSDLPAN